MILGARKARHYNRRLLGEEFFSLLLLTFLSRIITNVLNTDFINHFMIDKNESWLTAIPAGYNY